MKRGLLLTILTLIAITSAVFSYHITPVSAAICDGCTGANRIDCGSVCCNCTTGTLLCCFCGCKDNCVTGCCTATNGVWGTCSATTLLSTCSTASCGGTQVCSPAGGTQTCCSLGSTTTLSANYPGSAVVASLYGPANGTLNITGGTTTVDSGALLFNILNVSTGYISIGSSGVLRTSTTCN